MKPRCLICNRFLPKNLRCQRFSQHLWEKDRIDIWRWEHNGSVTALGRPTQRGWYYILDRRPCSTRLSGERIGRLLESMLSSVSQRGDNGEEYPFKITKHVLRKA